ncbi:MAG: MotA/TolQ/ExbB proton channel family protein [Calditrichia bacterium]
MFDVLVKGGWMMYPLMLSSVIALAVSLERLWALRRKKIIVPEIVAVIDQIKEPEDLNLAKSVCQKFEGPFANILLTTIENQDLPPDELRTLVEDEGRQQIRSLQRGLVTLETIASVAPLIGLLGTVFGMIKVFDVIQSLGVGQAKALSGGISEALVTTAAGLLIGIPTLIAYNYFQSRSTNYILDMEKYILILLNKLIRFNAGKNAEEIDRINLNSR